MLVLTTRDWKLRARPNFIRDWKKLGGPRIASKIIQKLLKMQKMTNTSRAFPIRNYNSRFLKTEVENSAWTRWIKKRSRVSSLVNLSTLAYVVREMASYPITGRGSVSSASKLRGPHLLAKLAQSKVRVYHLKNSSNCKRELSRSLPSSKALTSPLRRQ